MNRSLIVSPITFIVSVWDTLAGARRGPHESAVDLKALQAKIGPLTLEIELHEAAL